MQPEPKPPKPSLQGKPSFLVALPCCAWPMLDAVSLCSFVFESFVLPERRDSAARLLGSVRRPPDEASGQCSRHVLKVRLGSDRVRERYTQVRRISRSPASVILRVVRIACCACYNAIEGEVEYPSTERWGVSGTYNGRCRLSWCWNRCIAEHRRTA